MPLLQKEDLMLVDLDEMNTVHFEELDIVNNIYDLIEKKESGADNDEEIIIALDGFVSHTEGHFANEQRLMDKYMFPATHCHQAEHDSALADIKMLVAQYKENRDIVKLKLFFKEELVTWLGNHIATMDMVTASFISQQG